MCNSGVGLTPVIHGQVHHFSAGGLYDGLVLLIDDETETYWDHITGEAVHGPLLGTKLPQWPLYHTTVAAALVEFPGLPIHRLPPRSLIARAMTLAHGKALDSRGFIPPPFRSTMEQGDDRLPERTNGLGVVVDGRARFYPMAALKSPRVETWQLATEPRELRVGLGELDGAPHAVWTDDGSRPMQLLARWYGFSATFPGCEIAD